MAQFRKDTHTYLNQEKTIFEVVMLADQYGNLVGPANPSGAAVDAFGRARTGLPFTLFDSSNRYQDNGKFCTANTTGGTFGFVANTSTVDLTVNTTAGASVYRETTRVFAYQPGKSIQILNTFVMNAAKTNLRQRVGYFGANNGYYLERSSLTTSGVCFVERSYVTGAVVSTPVDQASWNVDKLDGTGPSLLTLNLDDPQILFIDMEWLGVGSVRMGFVINGQPIICHRFDHANIDAAAKGAYMQTACLPVRYEIENTGVTSGSSTLKQVCSTVISEGGYELTGKPREIGTDPVAASQTLLSSAGTYYPVMSIRLNPAFPDAIVIPKQIAVLPINAANYKFKIVSGATITGGVWANVTTDSTVQYNTNTTAVMSGGNTLSSGYITSTVQGGGSINLQDSIFKYQLERNSLANTTTTFTLAVTCGTATSNACGSISFEEVVY
jgi:hypothetical protein